MNNKINGIGKIFPITQIGIAVVNGTLSKDAASNPPRNSKIGINDIMNTAASLDIIDAKCVVNHATILSKF